MDVGSYLVDDAFPIAWYANQTYAMQWQCAITAYWVGKLPLNNQQAQVAKNETIGFDFNATARISTITPFIYLPSAIYKVIILALIKDKQTYTVDRFIMSSCDPATYSSIHLRLGDNWFEIKPETFIINQRF